MGNYIHDLLLRRKEELEQHPAVQEYQTLCREIAALDTVPKPEWRKYQSDAVIDQIVGDKIQVRDGLEGGIYTPASRDVPTGTITRNRDNSPLVQFKIGERGKALHDMVVAVLKDAPSGQLTLDELELKLQQHFELKFEKQYQIQSYFKSYESQKDAEVEIEFGPITIAEGCKKTRKYEWVRLLSARQAEVAA